MKMLRSKAWMARKLLLLVSGTVAAGIAIAILLAHDAFYASYGIELAGNTNLTNELKAPAGVLFIAGLIMLAGLFRERWTAISLTTAAAIYLPYGLSRVLSMVVDGVPNDGLVAAAIFEIVVGAVCLAALVPSGQNRVIQQTS